MTYPLEFDAMENSLKKMDEAFYKYRYDNIYDLAYKNFARSVIIEFNKMRKVLLVNQAYSRPVPFSPHKDTKQAADNDNKSVKSSKSVIQFDLQTTLLTVIKSKSLFHSYIKNPNQSSVNLSSLISSIDDDVCMRTLLDWISDIISGDMGVLGRDVCVYIYTILARLSIPLLDDTHHVLYKILTLVSSCDISCAHVLCVVIVNCIL